MAKAKTKTKAESKSGAAKRGAKKAVARAAKAKLKHVKRATPIKQSSKSAKKAAPRKPAKSSPLNRSASKAKPAAHKPASPVKKAAAARKPAPKKAVVKKPAQSRAPAKRPAPVKSAPAKPQPHHKTEPQHNAKAERGGVAVATPGSEPTITKEDGRYALPATVNIELPKGYRPSPKEEYMGPKQLAYFRNKLRDWRDQLVEESRQTMENLREEVRDVGDDAERATRETENSLELRTRDRYRKLISKIDKALRRIEEGRYGFCEETDEEIGIERLEARPIATLSLDAQERREHLQKQMGD
ncbi:MAG: RNA polymerase-binding protein DksA [Rhodanobacteraceae bacterium]|jgi:DnaK suppressor protein